MTLPVLSVIVSVAVRAPAAVGVNVTEMVQFAPTAMVAGQVVDVALKSAELVPVRASDPGWSRPRVQNSGTASHGKGGL